MSPTSLETARLLVEPTRSSGHKPDPAPLVRLLGPVLIEDAPGPIPLSRPGGAASSSAAEIVARLALHPDGVTADELLDITGCAGSGNLHVLLSRIRRWLGCSTDGTPRLRRAPDHGPWQLQDVDTDLALLEALTTPQAGLQDLLAALQLVTGIPLSGARQWGSWAVDWRSRMTQRVTEVAHRAANEARDADHLDAARWAVTVGRVVLPESEELWSDALKIEIDAGIAAGQCLTYPPLSSECRT